MFFLGRIKRAGRFFEPTKTEGGQGQMDESHVALTSAQSGKTLKDLGHHIIWVLVWSVGGRADKKNLVYRTGHGNGSQNFIVLLGVPYCD
jgi:hypothetical protein